MARPGKEACSWCGAGVEESDGFRAYEPAGERRAVFCRLEHVVPWAIQGPHWEAGTLTEPAPIDGVPACLLSLRQRAGRDPCASRPPSGRAPGWRRFLLGRAHGRLGEGRGALAVAVSGFGKAQDQPRRLGRLLDVGRVPGAGDQLGLGAGDVGVGTQRLPRDSTICSSAPNMTSSGRSSAPSPLVERRIARCRSRRPSANRRRTCRSSASRPRRTVRYVVAGRKRLLQPVADASSRIFTRHSASPITGVKAARASRLSFP